MSQSSGPVSWSLTDGVATVTVDNPPVNAMGREVIRGLKEAADELERGDARSVVVIGTGTTAFMAGADISEFKSLRSEEGGMEAHSLNARAAFDAWAALSQPVIAAVQASAVGGGLEFALISDLIIADPAARFGLPEVKLGLIPGGGGTQRLSKRVGLASATEMLFLGSTIDATRAQQIGLVNQIAEPGEVGALAAATAAKIAGLPRVAMSCLKRALAANVSSVELVRERELFLEAYASEDFGEGFSAFLEKRRPVFTHS